MGNRGNKLPAWLRTYWTPWTIVLVVMMVTEFNIGSCRPAGAMTVLDVTKLVLAAFTPLLAIAEELRRRREDDE